MRNALARVVIALGRVIIAGGRRLHTQPTLNGIQLATGAELRSMGETLGVSPETDVQYRVRVLRATRRLPHA
jgi:hypothetical protein